MGSPAAMKGWNRMKTSAQVLAGVGAAASLFFLSALTAAPQDALGPREPGSAHDAETLSVRCARANLRLAEIDLEIVLAGNRRVANLHSTQSILRLRDNVASAQDALDYELSQTKEGLAALRVRRLERALRLAEADLAAAMRANQQAPGSVSGMEMERRRVVAEVHRLTLQMARDRGAKSSVDDQLRWQVEQLHTEVTRLSIQLEELLRHH